jgi:hypothetical protein
MSAKKRLKIWLIISSLALASCKTLPKKPEGDLCIVDVPRYQLICAKISKAETTNDLFDMQTFFMSNEVTTIPLLDADKYIAFSPDTWGNIEVYIKKLEDQIVNEGQ